MWSKSAVTQGGLTHEIESWLACADTHVYVHSHTRLRKIVT